MEIDMKIGINLRRINRFDGIGTYTYNLLANLSKIEKNNEYFLFCNRNTDIFVDLGYNFRIKKISRSINSNRMILRLTNKIVSILIRSDLLDMNEFYDMQCIATEMKKEKMDLAHDTGFAGSLFYQCKSIVTLHDMTFKLFPENLTDRSYLYWNTWMPLSAIKADKVITDSRYSKQDIMRLLKIDSDKIEVIYGAANDIYKPISDQTFIEDIKRKWKINSKFILYVGTLEPRKNLVRLVQAFHKLKRENIRYQEYKLVFAGGKGWLYNKIFETVKKLDMQKEVVFTGPLKEDDLLYLYNAADLFVYPSLYEGFGLPPLEAMACGTPVITSNTSSLPEVVGDAGIMVDPYNIDELAKAMHKVLSNDGLREDMIKNGLERAKMFNWEKYAREILRVYEEVYEIPT
jgi:glycosyltransferase involved in cell wall biosynthesis